MRGKFVSQHRQALTVHFARLGDGNAPDALLAVSSRLSSIRNSAAVVGAGAIGLVDHEDIGDSRMPALIAWTSSPMPGTVTITTRLRRAHDIDLGLARADRLDDDGVEAGGVERRDASRGGAASPPRLPRLAMLRMKTPGSPASSCMRMRSPRIAPPVNGLVGSTAMMPMVRPRRRSRAPVASPACSCPRPASR